MEKVPSKTPYSVDFAARLFAIVMILGLMYYSQNILLPILFAAIISISLYPLTRLFEQLRLGKAISSLLAVIVAIAILSGLFWFIIHQSIIISQDASSISDKVISVLESGQKWLAKQLGIGKNEVLRRIQAQGTKTLENAGGIITSTFGSLGNLIANSLLVPLYCFFMLYYRDFFREFFFKVFKSSPKEKVNNTLNKIYEVVQSYLVGLISVMGIVAVLNTAGLILLDIEYAWFFGTLASLLMLLPYIGITIGSILPALFALAVKDNILYAVGVIAWFQFVQFLEGNLITPNIVGSKTSINPLIAIIAILVGGVLFGLSGLILALPLTAILKVVFDAMPSMQAFGFLIGEPEKEHLKRNSTQELLIKWGIVREPQEEIVEEENINSEKEKPNED